MTEADRAAMVEAKAWRVKKRQEYLDKRNRALQLLAQGEDRAAVAERLGVTLGMLTDWRGAAQKRK